jgi:Cu/Ag efflux pump CusA
VGAVAVRGALVQLSHYEQVDGDVARGSRERFTPTVTGMLATGLALVPMVIWGAVAGLEIVTPLALIVLGGLVTTALVNLFVLPALYPRFAPKEKADA